MKNILVSIVFFSSCSAFSAEAYFVSGNYFGFSDGRVGTYAGGGISHLFALAKTKCASSGQSLRRLSEVSVRISSDFDIDDSGRSSAAANPVISYSASILCD